MADRTYRATRRYTASVNGRHVTLAEGDTIELDDAAAAFIERDSPGTLAPADHADAPGG